MSTESNTESPSKFKESRTKIMGRSHNNYTLASTYHLQYMETTDSVQKPIQGI
jgi:hypothetical protein